MVVVWGLPDLVRGHELPAATGVDNTVVLGFAAGHTGGQASKWAAVRANDVP